MLGIDTKRLDGGDFLRLDHLDSVAFLVDQETILLALKDFLVLLTLPNFLVLLHLGV